MTIYKLLNKNRNKNNIITSYTLIDQQGKRVDVNPIELKAAIKGKKVKVLGLTLTSDFRLVDGAAIKEKQPAPVKKPAAFKKPDHIVESNEIIMAYNDPSVNINLSGKGPVFKSADPSKHLYEIIASLVIDRKVLGYVILNKQEDNPTGKDLQFVLRNKIKNYDVNMQDGKVIWKDANQAKKNQKIFQETIKSQFPTKDMNYEYETTDIEDDPSDAYAEDIYYALEALNLKFEDLNSFKDPIGMLTKAWDRVKKDHINEDYDPPYGWHDTEKDKSETKVYKAVNKTIYIFGVMKMVGQFLNKENYLTDMLQDSENMCDFYIKYVEQTEWINNAVYKICKEMNKGSVATFMYSKAKRKDLPIQGLLYKTLYSIEYVDGDDQLNYSMYNPERIQDSVYDKCLKVVEKYYEGGLDDLDKMYFIIRQQIDVSYHDGIYLDRVTICKGYKNAVYCFAVAATRILQEVMSYFEDMDEDSLNGVTLKETCMTYIREWTEDAIKVNDLVPSFV